MNFAKNFLPLHLNPVGVSMKCTAYVSDTFFIY